MTKSDILTNAIPTGTPHALLHEVFKLLLARANEHQKVFLALPEPGEDPAAVAARQQESRALYNEVFEILDRFLKLEKELLK